MRTNFVLIDFENVQPKDLGLLKDGPFIVKLFLGPNQSKITSPSSSTGINIIQEQPRNWMIPAPAATGAIPLGTHIRRTFGRAVMCGI